MAGPLPGSPNLALQFCQIAERQKAIMAEGRALDPFRMIERTRRAGVCEYPHHLHLSRRRAQGGRAYRIHSRLGPEVITWWFN
jgi:hypothetical protein